VDERLIHGQVVVGWGNQLHPDRIVVVDDSLADSAWEQDLYALGLPARLDAVFVGVDVARSSLRAWRAEKARVVLLTRDVHTMRRIAEHGALRGEEVNIGGLHHAPGRHAVLPYVHLSDAERREVRRLAEEGAIVSARDLPNARGVGIEQLLSEPGATE
jgi:PTS system mannose-specific IIB component/fructoselysine and glucoselysine-specific PTS system IIB component